MTAPAVLRHMMGEITGSGHEPICLISRPGSHRYSYWFSRGYFCLELRQGCTRGAGVLLFSFFWTGGKERTEEEEGLVQVNFP